MKSITVIIIVFCSALTVSGLQAEIYSWTDENGVKHYSHTPPPERSVPVKRVPEVKSDPTAYQIQEKINETNVEAIIKQLDQAESVPTPEAVVTKKPPTRQERIDAEAEKLKEKIAWLDQLPPRAFTNTRSKQAIIGRYQYQLEQLLSDPDGYFKTSGN